jgi:hypothetical protein
MLRITPVMSGGLKSRMTSPDINARSDKFIM